MDKLVSNVKKVTKDDISGLHEGLSKIKLNVSAQEKDNKLMGKTTVEAIKEFQTKNSIKATGKLNKQTLKALNSELSDVYHTQNKTRTEKLHKLLEKNNLYVAPDEKRGRLAGETTRIAVAEFQKEAGLAVDGKLNEEVVSKLEKEAVKKTLSSKTQVGKLHATILRAAKIAKLPIEVSSVELREKTFGRTTANAIKLIQEKYKLPQTGELDKETLDRLQSVAASRGVKIAIMKEPQPNVLSTVNKTLRLNMVSPKVAELQRNLAFLGYKIDENEFKTNTFGKTTKKALRTFQKRNSLPETGNYEKETVKKLNSEILKANPSAADSQLKYKVRGSVRDEMFERKGNMVIHVFEKLLDGESTEPLVTKKTHLSGFFDIIYQPPVDPNTKQVKKNYHLVVKLLDSNDKLVDSQIIYNASRIQWVNFNLAGTPYKGDSEYTAINTVINKALKGKKITDLAETANSRQISYLSIETKLSTDAIMRFVLANRVAQSINNAALDSEVFYAFIGQNLPDSLPGDLLRSTNGWETIDQLTETAANGIVFSSENLLEQALDNAISANLVTPKIKLNKVAILQGFKNLRIRYTLEKPILTGNGSLKSLLEHSTVSKQYYSPVADAFLKSNGVNDYFWEQLKANAPAMGEAEINNLSMILDIGSVVKNHMPTVQLIKNNIGTGKKFKTASDIAKLDHSDWVALINQNGKNIPDGTPGNDVNEKVEVYANTLKTRAEILYPAVSLVASVKKGNAHRLKKIDEIAGFIDDNPDFDFVSYNLDKYCSDKKINIDERSREEIKVFQRVKKLAPETVTGKAMIELGLHSSSQVYFTGKSRLTEMLRQKGVDSKYASKLYEQAKMKYMQVLARMLDFRREMNIGNPQAIIPQTFTEEEIKEYLGDIPNIEALFGSKDYCECEHCQSLLGPPAYLADLLRFLNQHNSLVRAGGETLTVKDVLFQRRPDLGNIKLNCKNTETPVPYIDLVCEILESYISPQQRNFEYQTDLDAGQVLAIPQNVRSEVYDKLAKADYPIYTSFNLWQEEARTNLNYLRVPRYELMEAFRNCSDQTNKIPDDISIAAEYFGISTYETSIITTPIDCSKQSEVDILQKYWGEKGECWSEGTPHFEGIDVTLKAVPVKLFLKRTNLSYYELLDLQTVKCINDAALPKDVGIVRPANSSSLDLQMVDNLSKSRLDRIQRFIRLWRKTGLEMWQLDLLIRNDKIGKGKINGNTIINLKRFKQLQEKLLLPLEILLAFYGDINTEERLKPDNVNVKIKPLYDRLFQNPVITNPPDSRFVRPLDNKILIGSNSAAPYNGYNPVPVILSALAIKQDDFEILKALAIKQYNLENSKSETNLYLTESSLSLLLRYTYLARSLKLSFKDLEMLLGITGTVNPFASVQATLELVKNAEAISVSGISLVELDYLLHFIQSSPAGLRDETICQVIGALRQVLVGNDEALGKLGLDEVNTNRIMSFNANALTAMTHIQVLSTIKPLADLLEIIFDNFKNAGFAVEETEYITRFSIDDGFVIETLIKKIKGLQENIRGLLSRNRNTIVSRVASDFGLTDQQSKLILEQLIIPGQIKTLIQILEDKSLLVKNPDGSFKEINADGFMLHFKAYMLIHKVSLLIQRMNIQMKDLEYFQGMNSRVKTLDLASLPLDNTAASASFAKWLNLFKFLGLKSQYPESEDSSLYSILDKAMDAASSIEDIYELISKLTQWNKADLIDTSNGLSFKKSDYTDASTYEKLQMCFAQINLTGLDAKGMFKLAKRDEETSQQECSKLSRLAVKSKYENEDWLEKIKPLQDNLREKKRDALISYNLEVSQRSQRQEIVFNSNKIPNPLYWEDSNSLFRFFLIDVEMGSMQLTSRMKQAINSVQLFVQRCFLNLEKAYVLVSQNEKEDIASENAWSQWKWMKNYRIWEANRKVFFYPENWIEPELRDDKSPFFKELEDELMQNETTQENVESAFLNYLHKVDEVSHLEVCGMYHEMEELNYDELGFEINNVHVIARTKTIPSVYYYRKYDMNYSTWTAWEKLDIDISGDHAMPVVYNRKLHLFWLVFVEKPQKMSKVPPAELSGSPMNAPEPQKFLEVQLAWSVRRENGWSAKKISSRKLIHPWERPHHSYNLKPYYKAVTNELWLDIYLSTSIEFNNRKFYDPFTHAYTEVTGNRFNETYLPWHSASFVFDGDVKSVKLKGLNSYAHIEFDFLGKSIDINQVLPTTSYDYVHNNFGEDGKRISMFNPDEDGPRLRLPNGMHFRYNHLTNNMHNAVNSNELRVLEGDSTKTLFAQTISPFELVVTQQDLQMDTLNRDHPFFYQDSQRAFFIKPEWHQYFDGYGRMLNKTREYRAMPFYHPYTLLFIRELNRSGVDGLLTRKIQINPYSFAPADNFKFNDYKPSSSMAADDAFEKISNNSSIRRDSVDFSFGGAYSIYNWELFFHAPMMIAARLSQNQRFEEAMKWFHYVFDPTDIENLPTPKRYWKTKPFFNFNSDDYRKQRIENILSNLDLKENKDQLKAWKNNPFKPHLIARYRPVAYQRYVVMKYLDNLIAWGDQQFRMDTIESINQASLLYMLAYDILGKRPEKVPNVNHEELSFNEIEDKYSIDDFGNARGDLVIEDTLITVRTVPSKDVMESLPKIETFYFGIPSNENLLKYWDTIEDRLFKIRHSMNIEGIVRQLPLFEPPVDPALLVKAAAAGIDLSSVLNDVSTGTPHYRFRTILQKAIEFCNDVRALGEKLLSALEKKDAESLALLRSQHEIELLKAVREVKKKQIDEAEEMLGSLEKAKSTAEEKKNYYYGREQISALEAVSLALSGGSVIMSGLLAISEQIASGFYMAPSFNIGISGFGGSPQVTVSWGSENIAKFIQAQNSSLQHIGSILSQSASMVNTVASYQRRKEEWDFQARLAAIEIEQIQYQINAAQIRQAITEKELENQEMQIENSMAVDEYMRNKYTNAQLYNWMVTQISTVYFQAYQFAYEMAKKAEKCYQYELGIQNSSFIQFGYWDSLKKGLLAGDKLMSDLRKLEAAYLSENKRELEITKNISLAQISPLSLITLKQTGKCLLSLPEWLFNMDYPGHYMRRIKAVSISIPCVAGPYTSVNCTLSLLRSETRIVPTLSGGKYNRVDDDTRFITQLGSISSIATSHAQNDSGMFELNFNDDRYLPFEGRGVISEWQINLPKENNYFDFASISDLILHVQYTARDGGSGIAIKATEELNKVLPGSTARLFSLKHDFPTEWYKFFNPVGDFEQELVFTIRPEHYPFFIRGKINTLKVNKLELYAESKNVAVFESKLKVTNTDYEASASDVSPNTLFDNVPYASRNYSEDAVKPNALGEIRLKLRVKSDPTPGYKNLTQDKVDDIFLLCYITR